MNNNYEYLNAKVWSIEVRNKYLAYENNKLTEELEEKQYIRDKLEKKRADYSILLEESIEQDETIEDLEEEKNKLEGNYKHDCEYFRKWIVDLLSENEKLTKKIESRDTIIDSIIIRGIRK